MPCLYLRLWAGWVTTIEVYMTDIDDDLLVAKLIYPDAYEKNDVVHTSGGYARDTAFNRCSDSTCVALMEWFRKTNKSSILLDALLPIMVLATTPIPEAVFQAALKIAKEDV